MIQERRVDSLLVGTPEVCAVRGGVVGKVPVVRRNDGEVLKAVGHHLGTPCRMEDV